MKNKKYVLKYYTPAEDSAEGWEKYSLPIGNGYFGASLFGRTDSERIQFATNAFANDCERGGVSNFAEIRLDFGNRNVSCYERGLDISDGFAYTRYRVGETEWSAQAFLSYPDRVFVYKVKSTKKSQFAVRLVIPYLNERAVENGGRTGSVTVEGNRCIMRGCLPSRELIYEGRLHVATDGKIKGNDTGLTVSDATETTLFFVADTSYELSEEVFLEGNHKAVGKDPHQCVERLLNNAVNSGYDVLFEHHQKDYQALMARVGFDLGGVEDSRSTEQLLESYREGNRESYLEEVYYQYGRYLLVSSSRKGTPPSSLQGVWNVHDKSPWGSGYWHNINVQMNYWPAFSTNLAETFAAYADYNKAFRKQAENNASKWIAQTVPENYRDGQGECGWMIGTAAYCYEISKTGNHSGPGTGGLTTKLFWDYYDFTKDEEILKNVAYPAIHGMAKLLTKCVRNYDGEYLSVFSASPEQIIGGKWIINASEQPYYHTVGCAFDQQMIYENACDDLKCAEILGVSDYVTELEKEQVSKYSPVLIGYSGQIKEYREEHFYGEIGEAKHRHISQLVALYPGTQINFSTPAWLDAAKQTLLLRGDESTGWALAHRLCAWARTGDGEHAYLLLQNLLKERTYPNLWDVHPPFQIDGNFGALSGITEMLLQSHEGYLYLLPALPTAWKSFSFFGLKARGNFTVSATVEDGTIKSAEIFSAKGGRLTVRCEGIRGVTVLDENGEEKECEKRQDFCSFSTQAGKTYLLSGFQKTVRCEKPRKLSANFTEDCVKIMWEGNGKKYAVYRAVNDDKEYSLLGYTEKTYFTDKDFHLQKKVRLTYKVTAMGELLECESAGEVCFLDPATRLERERYYHILRQNNV